VAHTLVSCHFFMYGIRVYLTFLARDGSAGSRFVIFSLFPFPISRSTSHFSPLRL